MQLNLILQLFNLSKLKVVAFFITVSSGGKISIHKMKFLLIFEELKVDSESN